MTMPHGARAAKLKLEAKSLAHLLTHFPKSPFCRACQIAKMYRKQARRIPIFAHTKQPKKFGELITGDNIVVTSRQNPRGRGAAGERHCFVIKDRATNFVGAYPCKTKTSVEVMACITHFLGMDKCRMFYADNAREIKAALTALRITNATSTPCRHQSNGIIARTIRHVAHMMNVVHSPTRDKTAWVARHGSDPFTPNTLFPFGALVFVKTGLSREHPFAPGSKPAIFLGYHLQPGCEWKRILHHAFRRHAQNQFPNRCCHRPLTSLRHARMLVRFTEPLHLPLPETLARRSRIYLASSSSSRSHPRRRVRG